MIETKRRKYTAAHISNNDTSRRLHVASKWLHHSSGDTHQMRTESNISRTVFPFFFALNAVDGEYRLTSLSREGHHIFEGCNHMQHSSTELSTSGRWKMRQNNEINRSVWPPAQ